MRAIVNGEPRDLPDGTTIARLLDLLGAPRSGVAVARNERVVRRNDYDGHTLVDGDSVEIIKAVAGG